MTIGQLILRSLRFHCRTNLAVALAVMAASAVLTGALLVGDSMRGSLRHLLLDQLGHIDEVLVTDRFFRAELAKSLAEQESFRQHFSTAVPALVVRGTVEKPQSEGRRRAGGVTVFGTTAAFWPLGVGAAPTTPGKRQIVRNQPPADELGAQGGE